MQREIMSSLEGFLCLFLVSVLISVLHRLWWKPARVQKLLASQGIKGPSYKLVYGNTKEISSMKKETMSSPKSLSHDILSHVLPHFHSWTNIYGKYFLQWHGSQPQLVILDPELCKEIMQNKDRAYPKRKIKDYPKKLIGDSVLTTPENGKWTKLRKLANHAFHGENLKGMLPAMVASAELMLERWKKYEGKEIELFEEFKLMTSEVISKTAFGSSYSEGKLIFEMLMKLCFFAHKNFYTVRFPGISKFYKTSDEIEAEKIEKALHNSVMEIIKKREEKAILMSGEEDRFGSDYLGLLLKAHHAADDKQRISVEDLLDECKALYFAGQETTTVLLAWTVLLLAIHPDWQEEARKEVLQLFGKQTPNADGISKLVTMSMILNESLRLYPPVVSLVRRVEKEARLGKFTVPVDLDLVIPILALHHEPEFWGPDVQLFKPERFSDGVAKATNNNMGAFMPFGMGPRTCAGMNLVANEVKIALSMILQRYSFSLSPAYIHSPFQLLTLRPQHGVQVILHPLVDCP